MIKIVNIVGARPQFIKYCPVSRAIARHNQNSKDPLKDILIHTGQHYDYLMSKVFFEEFGIREPDYHLEVGSGSHGEQTGQILARAEEVLQAENPDMVLVYGDTNSTLGGALSAAKLHIPVAHVEAGLRSFNKQMPEEINRLVADHVSSVLFCPSLKAIENLKREGLSRVLDDGQVPALDKPSQGEINELRATPDTPIVINIGDIMYDVLLYTLQRCEPCSAVLERLNLLPQGYYLLTLHRAENTDSHQRLGELITFINEATQGHPVIFPMHPRTKKLMNQVKTGFADNIRVIEPLGYFDMITLLRHSSMLFTDSGGLQKEAYWLQVPCITLREETEWVETVESGWNVLFRNYQGSHRPRPGAGTAYGDGRAADRMVNLLSILGGYLP